MLVVVERIIFHQYNIFSTRCGPGCPEKMVPDHKKTIDPTKIVLCINHDDMTQRKTRDPAVMVLQPVRCLQRKFFVFFHSFSSNLGAASAGSCRRTLPINNDWPTQIGDTSYLCPVYMRGFIQIYHPKENQWLLHTEYSTHTTILYQLVPLSCCQCWALFIKN